MESQKLSKKPLFNLSKVLQETGIKADTLRAWERRYHLPAPSRTEGGHRLFSPYDIETIKWLLARQEEGMRISQAVDYWQELITAGLDPLEERVRGDSETRSSPIAVNVLLPLESLRQQWIESALHFDQEKASLLLDGAFAQFPWEMVGEELIFSALSEIGTRWYQGEITVQQEHFASELVLQKIAALINDAPAPFHLQKVILGTPEDEFHTIALMIVNLLLRYRGWDVAYLGANVPLAQLGESLQSIHPGLVVMTAARLKSAAALLEVGRFLFDEQTPLAFGGNIFTQMPELADRIPGIYLGRDLATAIHTIERHLSAPEPQLISAEFSNPYARLGEQLAAHLPALESAAYDRAAMEYSQNIPAAIIRDANQFVFQDMTAALKFGEINFLSPNMNWIKGLLYSQNYPPDLFYTYLANFAAVCQEELGPQSEPIVTLLEKLRSD